MEDGGVISAFWTGGMASVKEENFVKYVNLMKQFEVSTVEFLKPPDATENKIRNVKSLVVKNLMDMATRIEEGKSTPESINEYWSGFTKHAGPDTSITLSRGFFNGGGMLAPSSSSTATVDNTINTLMLALNDPNCRDMLENAICALHMGVAQDVVMEHALAPFKVIANADVFSGACKNSSSELKKLIKQEDVQPSLRLVFAELVVKVIYMMMGILIPYFMMMLMIEYFYVAEQNWFWNFFGLISDKTQNTLLVFLKNKLEETFDKQKNLDIAQVFNPVYYAMVAEVFEYFNDAKEIDIHPVRNPRAVLQHVDLFANYIKKLLLLPVITPVIDKMSSRAKTETDILRAGFYALIRGIAPWGGLFITSHISQLAFSKQINKALQSLPLHPPPEAVVEMPENLKNAGVVDSQEDRGSPASRPQRRGTRPQRPQRTRSRMLMSFMALDESLDSQARSAAEFIVYTLMNQQL